MNDQDISSSPSNDALQHLEQAYASEEQGEFDKALEECDAAIELDPHLAEVHNLRGIILEELGRQEEAVSAYRQAVSLDPDLHEAKENVQEIEAELRGDELEFPERDARAPILMPSEPVAPPPRTEAIPACSVCGRQDETLRVVVYPYVFSLVVMTYRRTFAGLWCKRHRNLRLILASLITATFGWIGIPFGLLFTPIALLKLAQGGDQPAGLNVRLLKSLAEHKLKKGDVQAAIRCLEASPLFWLDKTIRERLSELYRTHRPPVFEMGYPQVLPFAVAILSAVAVGALVGVLDSVTTMGFTSLFGGQEILIYLIILSWAPLVATAFIGGLILSQLIEWALTRTRCHQMSLGTGLAIVSASLALYGLPASRAVGEFGSMLLSGYRFESISDAILTSGAVLTRGGVWVILNAVKTGGTSEIIYLLILLACAAYYMAMSVSAAGRTVRWQQHIAAARGEVAARTDRALSPGWLSIISAVLGLTLLTGLFPQQGIVDCFEASAHVSHGVEFFQQGEIDEALGAFQEAIRLDPGMAEAHMGLGWTYYYQGELDRALEAFQKAISLDPDLADAYDGLGWTCYYQGELDKAVEAFQKATGLDPNLANAYNGLGWSYYHQGELDRAAEAFQKATGLDPDLADAYDGLGWTYYFQGELDRAVEAFQKALRLDPNLVDAYVGLGFAYLDQEDYKAAIDRFETAIELAPDLAEVYQGLGQAYYYQGALDEAVQQLQKAIRLNSQSPSAHLYLGWAYESRAEFEKAVEQYKVLVELQPDWGAPPTPSWPMFTTN